MRYDDELALPEVGEAYEAELVDGPCNGTAVRIMAITHYPAEHVGRPLNPGQTAWYSLVGSHLSENHPVWTYRFQYVDLDEHGL